MWPGIALFLSAIFLLASPADTFGAVVPTERNFPRRVQVNRERLTKQLERHEGLRLKPYHCSEGVWTVGYGHNLQSHGEPVREITLEQADAWLQEDIDDALRAVHDLFPTYPSLTDERQEVLVNMAFNLGAQGLAAFHSLQRAVTAGEWRAARESMKASKWARQVKERAVELAEQMATGISKET
jgi:lysozyme